MTTGKDCDTVKHKELTEAQQDFLDTCKAIGWGKLEVLVQNGEPSYSRLLEKTYQHKKKT